MKKRIAINGFGRIGRAVARIILSKFSDELELVAINDPTDSELCAHLFQFDSNYGQFDMEVGTKDKGKIITAKNKEIRKFSCFKISELDWEKLGIDIVIESTGLFRTKETAEEHLRVGAKKVLLSAPAKSPGFKTIVRGVNEKELKDSDALVSNASCTTNCLAPIAQILDLNFTIQSGLMTTVHSYTNDQRILDVGHKDFRRARAGALNIIPTTTGAAKSVGLVIPQLTGKIDGISIRVPTPTVSLVDFVATVASTPSAEDINTILRQAAEKSQGILGFETRPLVSRDFLGDSRSAIVDAEQTKVTCNQIKVIAWYDNEWGYSYRLAEILQLM